jgi:hypothetical protein
LLVAASAHALPFKFVYPTAADSWETIRKSESLAGIAQGPFAQMFGSEGYFNACLDGDTFRSIKPQEICVETNMGAEGSATDCTKFETRHAAVARTQTEQRCVKKEWVNDGGGEGGSGQYERCVESVPVTYRLPTKMNFVVYGYYWMTGIQPGVSQGEGGSNNLGTKVLFNKEFQVPNCK